MNELLEVYLQTELQVNDSDVMVVEETLPLTLEVVQKEVLLVDKPVIEILEVALQGPPGPPGSGGSGGSGGSNFETVLDVDYSNNIYSYIGTATKISRVDYSTSPPSISSYSVINYANDWLNRQILIYA